MVLAKGAPVRVGKLWRARIKRWALAVATLISIVTISTASWLLWFEKNFGVVDPGRVFRSAQPKEWLGSWIDQYGIHSVLNLRGGAPSDPFYANEVRITNERDIAFYDLPLNASRRPTRRELLILLDFFKRCDYPVLIHCKSGADRTGLATALYLLAVKGVPPREAERAFTLEYGHVAAPGSTLHLHEPLREYAAWLDSNHLEHTPARFQTWVEAEYPSDGPPGMPPILRPGPRRMLVNRPVDAISTVK